MAEKRTSEEKELFYAYLRQNGLKKTYQKDLILETFLNTEGHLSVEDIHGLVRKKDKKVGLVTVFRTLKSLTACGIAREILLGDGVTRFEHSYHHPHHHHIVCTECNKAIEFISPELERVQSEIVARYHFHPVQHRFQIFGVCRDCRENRAKPETREQDTEKIFARDALKMALLMETRGIDFYREATSRNTHPEGRAVFRRIAKEEERHLSELKGELEDLLRREKGLQDAPIFLHFDPCELERLVPNLQDYEENGKIRLDARQSLEVAMELERRAAGFFKEYSEKFKETRGKKIFEDFAREEMKHYESISRRMEEVLQQ